MKSLLFEHKKDVRWGELLVDSRNIFNEINRASMIFHKWSSGARFSFNTYQHWKVLVMWFREKTDHIKEGFTQGETLDIVFHEFGLIPLSRSLTHPVQDIIRQRKIYALQVCYADDSALGTSLSWTKNCFAKLFELWPPLGYHPEPEKSIIITSRKSGVIEAPTSYNRGLK